MDAETREKVRRLAEWVREYGFDCVNYKKSGGDRQRLAHADAREILAALDAEEPFPRPSVEKGIRSVVATWTDDEGLKVWVDHFDGDGEESRFSYAARAIAKAANVPIAPVEGWLKKKAPSPLRSFATASEPEDD